MSLEKEILSKLERIERGLYGDEDNEYKGVISRVKDIENYVDEDRLLKQKIGGAVWIIGAIWTALTTFAAWVINKI
jgi:hypothetical protein